MPGPGAWLIVFRLREVLKDRNHISDCGEPVGQQRNEYHIETVLESISTVSVIKKL